MNKSRGRPPVGTSDARERILAAAQHLFPERGYSGTTLRAIAAEAGCDVALISHHYGSKKDLFASAMALTLKPTLVVSEAVAGEPDTVPERLVEAVLRAWDDPANRAPLIALFEAGMQQPEVMQAFRQYLEAEVVGTLVEYFHGRAAARRAAATMTLVIGVIFGRYMVGIEPLSSWPACQVLEALRPALRAAGSSKPGPLSGSYEPLRRR